jgi:hypothetical protein
MIPLQVTQPITNHPVTPKASAPVAPSAPAIPKAPAAAPTTTMATIGQPTTSISSAIDTALGVGVVASVQVMLLASILAGMLYVIVDRAIWAVSTADAADQKAYEDALISAHAVESDIAQFEAENITLGQEVDILRQQLGMTPKYTSAAIQPST